ncbi:MAG: superoxide dismutase [Lachnospiraceae bacterium]|nr:superoxide dismutase [Lachnospiraceae bacterium]
MHNCYPFVNYPLPYSYAEMEPYIDIQTMYLHHAKHLQAYIDKLNDTLSEYPLWQKVPLEKMLTDIERLPKEISESIRHNGGGVFNHQFFFANILNAGMEPTGNLLEQMVRQYGSVESFFEIWKKEALAVFGSGYLWLTCDSAGSLQIFSTANQDTPLSLHQKPLVVIDVWEHAYYLKFKNVRAAYIDNWWQVINWERAERLYTEE